jgi:hypothetical protein
MLLSRRAVYRVLKLGRRSVSTLLAGWADRSPLSTFEARQLWG